MGTMATNGGKLGAFAAMPEVEKMKAERLKQALKKKGWSQKDLSKETGISEASISLYMHADCNATVNTIMKICRALDISTDYLLGIEK